MDNLRRIGKYTLLRGVLIVITVAIGVYLTVIIATMGGYMDKIMASQIREQVGTILQGNEELRKLPPAELKLIIDQMVEQRMREYNLHTPWIVRSFRYLANALTLNLGMAEKVYSDSGSRQVRLILTERLPATLLLMVTANLIVFFSALFTALVLSRHYGSPLDRAVVALSPTSAAPAWFYGIFLILIFASVLRVLPYGGMVSIPPPKEPLAYALSVLKHLVLPVSAWFLAGIFSSVYYWRTFFLIYSSEDYVEMAKAKGLSSRAIERRYILRPTLPPIITSFGLMLITTWMGAIILENVFTWPGLGRLLQMAINLYDAPVIVGEVVIYAYLLGITVFLLDIAYAALDPRVKLGAGGRRPA
ncbi:MAG: ABC transporter permease [Candidatus Bipolaricaulota bacterium]|nr:ABC transporter permease [Candidatus Bipolaricaulota bacterium]